MRVLAVIPARGGSKRVPRKNLRSLGGRTLVSWSIQAGLEAKLVNRVVVSTEDEEIAHVAQGWGAEIVWRPPELATDEALTDPVLVHALSQDAAADAVVLLQPTVPLRPPGLVDRCIARLAETGAGAVHTVEPAPHHFVWWEEEDYSAGAGPVRRRWVTQCPRRPRRQDMRDRELMFLENGAVTVTSAKLLQETGSRLGIVTLGAVEYRGRIECVETERMIDIDTEADLAAAEAILTLAVTA